MQHAPPMAAETRSAPNDSGGVARYAGWVKLVSLALILVGLMVLARSLPIDRGVGLLSWWVDSAGLWGPVFFGVVYVVAAVLFVPGAALTLAAGAVFGLLWGTITVSLASTMAAAVAFLIARYLARSAVESRAKRNPKFGAIDGAIGQGGWKIIALLRLSPVIPFSLGNYLFGLTAIRFWPYALTSWIAMLPGTFMYVYLGYAGRAGLAAAGGAQAQRGAGQWVMLVVGLLATMVVTVYVTKIARRAVQEHTQMEDQSDQKHEAGVNHQPSVDSPRGDVRGTMVSAFVAIVVISVAACAHWNQGAIHGLFGPPAVAMAESYSEAPGQATFDHSAFDRLLKKHVSPDGWVDYAGLVGDADQLDAYIKTLAQSQIEEMDRNQRLALLINAYNAFTLRLILDYYPLKSIKDIPTAKRWADKRWQIGSLTLSLNQIEHEQIRPHFKEPRIHFALVCAAVGCPPLRNEAYVADRLEAQLASQSRYVHSHDRWLRFDLSQPDVVYLTSLYNWYGGDFEQSAGSVLNFAAQYAPTLKMALDNGGQPQIRWLDYDWSLNSRENAR